MYLCGNIVYICLSQKWWCLSKAVFHFLLFSWKVNRNGVLSEAYLVSEIITLHHLLTAAPHSLLPALGARRLLHVSEPAVGSCSDTTSFTALHMGLQPCDGAQQQGQRPGRLRRWMEMQTCCTGLRFELFNQLLRLENIKQWVKSNFISFTGRLPSLTPLCSHLLHFKMKYYKAWWSKSIQLWKSNVV